MPEPNPQYARTDEQELLPATSALHWDLHVAAHEWDLAEPIVMESAEDFRSTASWRERVQPYAHQVQNLITFCRRLPVTLLADDVGLGKTISAGLILSELIARKRVTRTLVLAPKLLLPQWDEEMTTKFGLRTIAGSASEFDDALESDAQVVVTTYETARNRFEDGANPNAIAALASFDMLILDEAHRLRNLYPDGDVRFAQVVRRLLEERRFRFVLMLTATPMQNRLWDLYSLIDCMTVARGHKNPFGTPAQFERTYCVDHSGRSIRPGTEKRFREILAQYVARTRRDDAKLVFPERTVRLEKADLTPFERDVYAKTERLIGSKKIPKLAAISVLQAMCSSVDALHEQLGNMTAKNPACGALRTEIERSLPTQSAGGAVRFPLGGKIEALRKLIKKLSAARSDWRVVVFTGRRVTQARIVEELLADGYTVGTIRGGDPKGNQESLEGFRENPPTVRVIVSTDAGAEGVNLQSANVLVNIDLPWNPMKVEQRIGRIQRLGSKHGAVEILNIVAKGTFDEHLVGSLMVKLQTIAQTVGDIEAVLESTNLDDEDSFETSIFNLIMRSLLGQDAEAARTQMESSWSEAKSTLAQQERSIDETLGRLDALHSLGARLPDLARSPPTMTARAFVEGALRAERCKVVAVEGDADRFDYVTSAGALIRATYSDAPAPGVRSFAPMHAEFERLCERWIARSHARLHIAHACSETDARTAVETWARQLPLAAELVLETIDAPQSNDAFHGTAVVRWRGSNRHDAYESVVCAKVGAGERVGDHIALTDAAPIPAREIPTAVVRAVSDAIAQDKSIAEFLRFYTERAVEEAARADKARARVVREEYEPVVEQEIVALDGMLFKQFDVRAGFRARGSLLQATFQVASADERGACVHSASGVAMEHCVISGACVPSEWLSASSVSGLRALTHLFKRCEVVGGCILASEGEVSAASGKFVCSRDCAASAVSGLRAHRKEFVQDHATRELLLPTEFEVSDFSTQRYRRGTLRASVVDSTKRGGSDELVACEVSGIPLFLSEGARCAVTNNFVDRRILLHEERDHRLCLASLIAKCPWTARALLKTELRPCALLGLSFDPNALDQQGVLRAISALRDGRVGQARVGAEAFFAARDPVRFKNIKQCTMVDAPATETFLIQLSTAGFLGFRPRLHYALVSQRASGELTLLALSEPQKA